ncbi:MAG: thioredoxin [Clostridia bacterium]|nr:thioredoxin [Clostridia bacterium]
MEVVLTVENFENEVLKSDKPVLVDFWATWCGPCRMIAPIIEEIANELSSTLKVGKVNVDEQEELAVRYGISSIPTLLLFKGGEVVKKTLGYMPKDAVLKFINE